MAFSEDNLEDKIKMIMSGNFNFGSPVKAPVPPPRFVPPAVKPAPVIETIPVVSSQSDISGYIFKPDRIDKNVNNSDDDALTSIEKDISVSMKSDNTEINSKDMQLNASNDPEQNFDMLSTSIDKPRSEPSLLRNNVGLPRKDSDLPKKEITVFKKDINEQPVSPTEEPIGIQIESAVTSAMSSPMKSSSLQRNDSALVSFGDVYEDKTNEVRYDERDLHEDAMSEGYNSLNHTNSAGSVNFGDLYEDHTLYERGKDEATVEVNEAETPLDTPVLIAKATDVQFDARQFSPKSGSFFSHEDEAAVAAESLKIQPQLDFVPLSQRSSPKEDSITQQELVAAHEKDRETVLRVESAPSPAERPLPVAAATSQQDKIIGALDDEEEDRAHSDAMTSMLFGEGAPLDESFGEEREGELSFAPDSAEVDSKATSGASATMNMDQDSLDGEEEGGTVSDELMQTVRTTVPLSPAVKSAPAIATSATKTSKKDAPMAEKHTTASTETSKAVSSSPLPPKPRSTTPSSLAREKAAYLLPTIEEEKAIAHLPKQSHKAVHGQAHLPIKVAAGMADTKDRATFLSRVSAATSITIEVPPPPPVKPRSTTPTSIPKPSQRSTTPTSISRPSSTGSASASKALSSSKTNTTKQDDDESAPVGTKKTVSSSAMKKANNLLSGGKKSSPVLMSSTDAEEIAMASGRLKPSMKSVATTPSKAPHAVSFSNKSTVGVKESTLLSADSPVEKEKAQSPEKPWSGKKLKSATSWIVRSSAEREGVDEAEATDKSPAPRSVGKLGAAAWVIENEPPPSTARGSPVKGKTPSYLSPVLRSAAKSHSPEASSLHSTTATSSRSKAVSSSHPTTSTSTSSAAGIGEHTPNVRSRAISPSTTARKVSRIASASPNPVGASVETLLDHPERAVKVAVRVRPFTQAETHHNHRRTISMNDARMVIVNPKSFEHEPDAVASVAVATDNRQWAHLFEFDNILWNYDTENHKETFVNQVELHKYIGFDIVENALNGISSSCFAYGHTCTGKTYSLFGSNMIGPEKNIHTKIPLSLAKFSINTESGLIQRVFHDIIRLSHPSTRIFITFMEIYNEKIRDLLSDHPSDIAQHRSHSEIHSNGSISGRIHAPTHIPPETLKLREHPSFGPYVENLVKTEVFSVQDALRLIAKGQSARSSTQTIWNSNSSRSHAVVTLELTPTEIDPSKQFIDPRARAVYENAYSPHTSPHKLHNRETEGEEDDAEDHAEHLRDYMAPVLEQVVRVQMVDLAGSERDTIRDDDEHALWSRRHHADTAQGKLTDAQIEKEKNELRLIRRSLSTLGYIIKALTKGASIRSLPYRDCTLTFLLKDALCGRNHTTMLATVSPSHTCYEETLATLRYAERLCEVHTNRRNTALISSNSGFISSIDQNTPAPRQAILDEYRRIHLGLRGSALHTDASRAQLRKLLLPSPAQPQSHKPLASTPPIAPTTDTPSSTNPFPLDSFNKPLQDITAEDIELWKRSSERLTTHLHTLQTDLSTVRANRDDIKAELSNTALLLQQAQDRSAETAVQVTNLKKYLNISEKERNQLHVELTKREENIHRVEHELKEIKNAYSSVEQAHQVRNKEFLARLEALKQENKVLTNSLASINDQNKHTSEDKKDLNLHIDRLKTQIKQLTQMKDNAQEEIQRLNKTHNMNREDMNNYEEKIGKLSNLEEDSSSRILLNQRLENEIIILKKEKESLVALLSQKDSQHQADVAQSERSIRTLQLKITALERANVIATAATSSDSATVPYSSIESQSSDADMSQLQQCIHTLLSTERRGGAAHSEEAVRHLPGLMHKLSVRLEELGTVRTELQYEHQQREALQRQLSEAALQSELKQAGKGAMDHQITLARLELIKAQEAAKKADQEHHLAVTVLEGSKASLEEQVSDLQKELLTTKDALSLTKTRLLQQTNLAAKTSINSADYMKLQAESAALKDQLIITQRDAFAAREELRTAQDEMQKEYTSLWTSVQELSKLDALKDQSIQDLLTEKNKAIVERDGAFERYATVKAENAQLMQEIQDIDVELLHAVEAGEYRLSPRGQHKSIMIHNISDRTMFGLARRQQQQQQHQYIQQQQQQQQQQQYPQLSSSGGSTNSTGTGGAGLFGNASFGATTPGANASSGITGMHSPSASENMGMQSPPAAYYHSPASRTATPILAFNGGSHSQTGQHPASGPAVMSRSTEDPSASARPPTHTLQQQNLPYPAQQQYASQSQHSLPQHYQQHHPSEQYPPQEQHQQYIAQSQQYQQQRQPPSQHMSHASSGRMHHTDDYPSKQQQSQLEQAGPDWSAASWSSSAREEKETVALSEEEQLERELQELSYKEGQVRSKTQHLKAPSSSNSSSWK